MSEWRELAEVSSDEIGYECRHLGVPDESVPGLCPECWELGGRVAEAVLAAGYLKPRTITMAEDVAGMVVDSIVRTRGGVLLELWEGESDEREWRVAGHRPWTDAELVKNLPATVLHEPESTR